MDMHLREKILPILIRFMEQKSQIQAFHINHYSFLFMNPPTLIPTKF